MNRMNLTDMTGKICLVTGASSGIGEATALELAKLNATVVGIGYHPQHIAKARTRIFSDSGKDVEFIQADLSSQAEVCRAADEVRSRYRRLDVLINNAGSFFPLRRKSVDGIEMNFALNHLAYYLLTDLLLDMLKANIPARVVNVSSNSHYGNPLDFEDLQYEHRYQPFKAYGRSKFANVLFSYELARRLQCSGINVNALHPGWVATNIARNLGFLARLFMPLIQINALSPRQGAQTSLYLASSPDIKDVTGSFFINSKPVKSDPRTYDLEAQSQLWQISAEMTGCKGD
jgi:NAD(P)-dependent dehydrogenase (short-subunit alcohol dehydrogenase family)